MIFEAKYMCLFPHLITYVYIYHEAHPFSDWARHTKRYARNEGDAKDAVLSSDAWRDATA